MCTIISSCNVSIQVLLILSCHHWFETVFAYIIGIRFVRHMHSASGDVVPRSALPSTSFLAAIRRLAWRRSG